MSPTRRLIFLALVAAVPMAAAAVMPEMKAIGFLLNLLIISAASADFVLTPRSRMIDVSRDVSEVLSVGDRNPVQLQLVNRSGTTLNVEATDEAPVHGEADGIPVKLTLSPFKEASARYLFQPHRRGHGRFRAVHLRYTSRLGLWTIAERRELDKAVRIYPDIRAVYRYELMARQNRLEEIGLKVNRLRGQGSEFERLREYRNEDEPRQIDWKATSRTQTLISREYNIERNQNVMILLDCGRSMRNESHGISHMDRSLNAAIMLSYIALGQGDNVSLMAFSNKVERYVRPLRGKPAIQTLIRHTFDLEAREYASDYSLAVENLSLRQRKRALVILITHATDEQHAETVGRYFRSFRSAHLLLCVFLRDTGLAELAARVPNEDIEAFESAAASELLAAQARHVAGLREAGVLVLETLPESLSAQVINQYLDVKARHLM